IIWERIAKCSFYGLVALALFFYGVTSTLFHAQRGQFLIEVEQEAAKVTLPQRSELVRSTIIIAIGTVIMALVLALVDYLNQSFLGAIQSLGGA
ncbi:MAG: preprotein translocase subunit SecE, partial [Planctomycetes bacterium]|nr:preprotein translocase subunit SecE [Planctomycetota bacterium]